MPKLFKYLNRDGSCRYAPGHRWPIPSDGKPGDWMPPVVGPLKRGNAYHACLGRDVLLWSGDLFFEVEGRGERVDLPEQVLLREARLVRQLPQSARLLAYMGQLE